jgi:hypothetical protein
MGNMIIVLILKKEIYHGCTASPLQLNPINAKD